MVAIGLAVALVVPALVVAAPPSVTGKTAPPQIMPDVSKFELNPSKKPYEDAGLTKSFNLDGGSSYTVKVTYTFPAPPPVQRGVPSVQPPGGVPQHAASVGTIWVNGPYMGGAQSYHKTLCVTIPAFKGTSLTLESGQFTVPAGNSLGVTVSVLKPAKDCIDKK
jgi:hypothetical protein